MYLLAVVRTKKLVRMWDVGNLISANAADAAEKWRIKQEKDMQNYGFAPDVTDPPKVNNTNTGLTLYASTDTDIDIDIDIDRPFETVEPPLKGEHTTTQTQTQILTHSQKWISQLEEEEEEAHFDVYTIGSISTLCICKGIGKGKGVRSGTITGHNSYVQSVASCSLHVPLHVHGDKEREKGGARQFQFMVATASSDKTVRFVLF